MARTRRNLLIGALALGLLTTACGADMDEAGDSGSFDDETSAGADGWTSETAPAAGEEPIYRAADEDGGEVAPVVPPGAVTEGAGGPASTFDAPTAGSVDDNELWDEYLLYRDEFFTKGIPVSDVPVDGRQLLTVVDVDGDPVLGATVVVRDEAGTEVATLRTYSDGGAVLLSGTAVDPNSQSRPVLTATVSKGPAAVEVALEPAAPTQTLALDVDVASPVQVDVNFLIDATGSMSDEIERLKASMISVSEQIGGLPSAPDVRFSAVVYRDRGDEYVTRSFDFTPDVVAFTTALSEVGADGGGDTPESLNAGLHDAVTGLTWRGDDTVKLVFLVADAAPHLAGEPGYEDEPDYADTIRTAAAEGIKVFPIASSGLDPQGEFVFRQLAQLTMGRFVFLTYGSDGGPGTSTPHDVDPEDYDVLALDQLVVQLVTDELAPLG
jgi:hypothetical protein